MWRLHTHRRTTMLYEDSQMYSLDTPNEAFLDTRNYLEGVMECIYDSGDMKKLEHCLEELCSLYDVEFELKPLKVCKNNEKREEKIAQWYITTPLIDVETETENLKRRSI